MTATSLPPRLERTLRMLLHPLRRLPPAHQPGRGYLLDRSQLLAYRPTEIWCPQVGRWCVGHRKGGEAYPIVEFVEHDAEILPVLAHCTNPTRTERAYEVDDPGRSPTKWASDVRELAHLLIDRVATQQNVPEPLEPHELVVLADLMCRQTTINDTWTAKTFAVAHDLVERGLVAHTSFSSVDDPTAGVWDVTPDGAMYRPFTRLRQLTTDWPKGNA